MTSGPGDEAEPARRGRLFGRRKGQAQPEPASERDEDYVDWVKGLGAETPTARAGSVRGRHAREGDETGGSSA